MIVIGHRGAAGHAPENTIAAIEKGIGLGVDFVEVDVQRTSDGHLVVMHDKRVDRLTDGSGDVSEMALEEVRRLRMGGERMVPTLSEVLECCRRRVGVMLEMISEGIAEATVRAVRESRFTGPVIYASFLHREVRDAGRVAGREATTMALFEGVPIHPERLATDAGAPMVGASVESLTPWLVEVLHREQLRIVVYTVNEREDIERVRALGVDGIVSDYPERVPRQASPTRSG